MKNKPNKIMKLLELYKNKKRIQKLVFRNVQVLSNNQKSTILNILNNQKSSIKKMTLRKNNCLKMLKDKLMQFNNH